MTWSCLAVWFILSPNLDYIISPSPGKQIYLSGRLEQEVGQPCPFASTVLDPFNLSRIVLCTPVNIVRFRHGRNAVSSR